MAVEDPEPIGVAGSAEVADALVLPFLVRDGVAGEKALDRVARCFFVGRLERGNERFGTVVPAQDRDAHLRAEPGLDVVRVGEVHPRGGRLGLELLDDEVAGVTDLADQGQLAQLGEESVEVVGVLALGADRRLDIDGRICRHQAGGTRSGLGVVVAASGEGEYDDCSEAGDHSGCGQRKCSTRLMCAPHTRQATQGPRI